MADYPSLVQAFGTRIIPDSGTKTDRAVSGKPRQRTYFTQVRNTINVVHNLDDTDKATLDAHYVGDSKNAFLFEFLAVNPPTQYTVRYMGAPVFKPIPGNRWAVTVSLVEV